MILSRRGIRVSLIEKSAFLGGQTARLDRLAPTGKLAENVVRGLAEDVLADGRITVHGCSEIVGYEGYVGNFKLTVQGNGNTKPALTCGLGDWVPFNGLYLGDTDGGRTWTIDTGAIVLATGLSTYRPSPGEFGFADFPGVVTLPEFIRLLTTEDQNGQVFTAHGRRIRRLAFIHCVGSRQIPGIHEPREENGRLNEHCSRTCCSAILQAAVMVRSRYPETKIFDYYRDIRTYGRGQEEVYEEASRNNVLFFRYEPDLPPVVEKKTGGEWPLSVRVVDTLTFGEELETGVDMVVLGVGIEADPIRELVEMMKLPVGADGFLQEVHPKLRPVELANTGILLAGTCQAPMDVGETNTAAQAAAVKSAVLLIKGYVELDPYVARVDAARCTGQGRCAEVCPVEGVVRLVDGKAVINPALCTGCGTCVGECPEQAIDINGWTLEQYEHMVDAIVAG